MRSYEIQRWLGRTERPAAASSLARKRMNAVEVGFCRRSARTSGSVTHE
jgi:hypothetical protein